MAASRTSEPMETLLERTRRARRLIAVGSRWMFDGQANLKVLRKDLDGQLVVHCRQQDLPVQTRKAIELAFENGRIKPLHFLRLVDNGRLMPRTD